MKSINQHVEDLQVGKVKVGWAWWSRLKAKQAAAASERQSAQNAYAETLVARKKVAYHNRHIERELELEHRQRELTHAHAELQLQQAELELRKLSRQADYTAALLTAIEQVTEEAARYGHTLPTHQAILKEEAFTELEIERRRAKTDDKIRKIQAKTYAELLLLDKNLEVKLRELEATTKHAIELLLVQGEQELKKMEWETDQQIKLLVKTTELRITETLTIEGARSQWRIDERNVETDNRIREHAELASIDIRKNLMLEWVKLQSRKAEIEQDHQAADRLEMSPLIIRNQKLDILFGWYERYQHIKQTEKNPWIQKKDLAALMQQIKRLEGELDGQETGLVLPENRKTLRRSLPPSERERDNTA
jgi:hypothetical protein